MASTLNHDAPCSIYSTTTSMNSYKTSGFEKSQSTWSLENVHQTCRGPSWVSYSCSSRVALGLVTPDTSTEGSAVMKNWLPGDLFSRKSWNSR